MKKWLKGILITLVVLGAGIQFVRPPRTNPPVDPAKDITAHVKVEPPVMATLERSCNDCHSNRTVWPVYSSIAPVSWLVVHDVNEGREEMNFSEWATAKEKEPGERLGKICKEVSEGEMPGAAYAFMHPKARLTQADVQAICNWTKSVAPNVAQTEKERDDDD
jgi:heme-binding protein